jgi:hypothetical protein
MARLYRPSIPVEVKCRVALRQLGEMFIDAVIEADRPRPGDAYMKGIKAFVPRRGLGVLLAEKLAVLAELLNCKIEDLRLDHNPALGARQRRGEGKHTVYMPVANDPEYLIYREKHAHHIKTNIRGDGAQHPDRVLIKRERRRTSKNSAKVKKPKRKWGSRPLRSASRWPQGRKFGGKR